MSDREFAEELQRRIKALRGFKKMADEANAKMTAAIETHEAARRDAKKVREEWRAAADKVREMMWGAEPIDPPSEFDP